MLNILFISQYLNVGGTETFMMNVFRTIDKKKFHIDFLIFSSDESRYAKEAHSLGAKIYRFPCRKNGLAYYRALDTFFKEKCKCYHAIHFCGGNVSSIAPIYFAYKYNIPVRIIHSHSSSCDGIHNKLLHAINRLLLPMLGTHYLACSTKAAQFFFRKHECVIVKNGIDAKAYIYDGRNRNRFREKLGIPDDTHVIGHIGRLEKVKNHDMILKVFQTYHQSNPNSLLLLVGNGTLLVEIKNKIVTMGLAANVILLGERGDIPDILSGMDCFLMPSFYEGLPFVLIEAQASGLPCVVANTVNRDAQITPSLRFLSLDDSPATWVATIENVMKEANRSSSIEYINEAGYNMDSTITFLERIYCEN